MSTVPPQVIPRKPSGVKVLTPLREQPRPENGTAGKSSHITLMTAEREVELLNHCFDDIERFMARLQQTAEAQSVLNQRTKRSRKKSFKDEKKGDDLLTKKSIPPLKEDFVDIFQKMKYSFCLLDRLKSSISQPDAPDLLHHIFLPLSLMVKTTEGPTLAASVESPAMTGGAVSFLKEHLTDEEQELWKSLGPNWTSHGSQLSVSAPPYTPVFQDGWQPLANDSAGQLIEDPVQSQLKEDAFKESRNKQSQQQHAQHATQNPGEGTEKAAENGFPPMGETIYRCSYDFVARNSNELSVLHGETLEVIDSSKNWWKCRNRYDEIGFVPSNILEPLSAVNNTERDHPVLRTESKKKALTPRSFSYIQVSGDGTRPTATSPTERHQSMILPSNPMSREDGDRVMVMNDELLQRLAKKRNSLEEMQAPSTAGTSVPLNYDSPSAEVKAWLTAKGFMEKTVVSLGVLNGAQLFSLKNEELCRVCPAEGESVYLQLLGQKAFLEDVRKVSELETVVEQ